MKLEDKRENFAVPWPAISKPLNSLDVFAGCGGKDLKRNKLFIAFIT